MGYNVRPHTDLLEVPVSGVDVKLRAPSARGFMGGLMLLGGGLGLAVAGAALVGVGEMGTTSLATDTTGSPTFVTHVNQGEVIGGGVLLGAATAMLGGGIALLALNRTGVASSAPKDPQAPSAKVSVGLGTVRVSGTF